MAMNQALLRRAGLSLATLAPFLLLLGYFATRGHPAPPPKPATAAPDLTANPTPDTPPSGHTKADFERMVESLQGKLAKHPEDVDGWVLLGRTMGNAERWPEAEKAFREALARRPDAPALHVQLGEVLVLKAHGQVGKDALAEFARLPDDPRSRFYGAVARAQSGDRAGAKAQLAALAADAPQDAPWRGLVKDEIAALDAQTAQPQPLAPPLAPPQAPAQAPIPPREAGPPAPNAATPAATPAHMPTQPPAQTPAQTPTQTVALLEQRVRAVPADSEAWLALARAYEAMGQRDHAADTLRRANQAVPGNLDLLLSQAQLLADAIKGDALPAEFVGIMRQVNAIDPNQPDALWYLGLDASVRGDTHRAREVWERLLARLPEASDEHAAVAERLKSLRPFVKP